ncbi:MAG: glycosyltransferase family 39 protein [Patescibacteria group bacterium]|nr:glycosyltransferase family 39 protein [Patescibacteria group bacterium]
MRQGNVQRYLFPAVLLLAIFLRFFQLGAADVISDEAMIAFRSVGYIDYLASPNQPTTWEKFSGPVPVWAYLSFHDHPPLTFAVQWLSFRIFGVNNFALRLPFALAGVASVYLVYLVCRRLFHEQAALLAALLVAVSSASVWVSRIGLQESLVIFFALLAVYWYRRALDDHRFLPAVGLALGLGILTKYTMLAVAAALLVHFFIYRRDYLRLRTFLLGGTIFLLLASPLIVYNVMLYKTFGHFDLQLSYLFGQRVAEWQSLPGKEQIGSWSARVANYWTNVSGVLSWPAFAAVLLSLGLFVSLWFSSGDPESGYTLLGLLTLSWGGMLLVIGPSTRFLSVLVVWLLMIAAVVTTALRTSLAGLRSLLMLGLVCFLIFELLFTTQTVLLRHPRGVAGLAYAPLLRSDVEHWGYAALDQYLNKTLAGHRPGLQPDVQLPFLKQLQSAAQARAERAGLTPQPLLIIYDANFYNLATLWILHRRLVYDGWPIITADKFLADGEDAWRKSGVRDFLFIQLGSDMLAEPAADRTDGAKRLESVLRSNGIVAQNISSPRLGKPAYIVYRWGEGASQ